MKIIKNALTRTCHSELVSESNHDCNWGKTLKRVQGDMRAGFTLAEVLITLGIIGIIAALTIPNLVASYQKKVLETRLKKFYSIVNQAVNMRVAEGNTINGDRSMITMAANPDQMEEYWKVNFAPYVTTTSVKKLTKGIVVGFPDGSGWYLADAFDNPGPASAIYSVFCVDYKRCANADESNGVVWRIAANLTDGKNAFDVLIDGRIRCHANSATLTREQLVEDCADKVQLCACLIQYDGWQIKDDYPW